MRTTPKPRTKPRMGRPLEFPGVWYDLAELMGGRNELARSLGVSERTIYRWANGIVEPSRLEKLQINIVCSTYGLPPIFKQV